VLERPNCDRRKSKVITRIWSKLGIAGQLYLLAASFHCAPLRAAGR